MSVKPIKTALCSMGMSGVVFHAPFLQTNPHYELTAVWERTKSVAAEKYPGTMIYRTYEDMLADSSIELVVVNTPNVTHYELAKSALMAGKHVLVEKPFASSVMECEDLMAIALQKNLILTVYHNRRYDSDLLTLRKLLDQKLLGTIREAEFHYDRFDNNLSYKTHKETPAKGTGCLYDLGSHLIDQSLILFGNPNAVFADIFAMREISKVDDYFELILYYTGFRVRLKASYQVKEALPAYVLHGSKGSFIKPRGDMQEKSLIAGNLPVGADWGREPDSAAGLLHIETHEGQVHHYYQSETGNYHLFFDGLYRTIREGDQLPVTPQAATNVIRIIEKAFESNREGKIISLKN